METTKRSNKNKNKTKYFMILTFALIIINVFLTSYAVLTKTLIGEKNYQVTLGTLDFKIKNETNSIRLMNAYPMLDSVGKTLTPYTFTLTNTGTLSENYKIYLIEDEEEKGNCTDCEFLNPNKLRYSLTKNGVESTTDNLSPDIAIDYGLLAKGQSINYELRIWMDSTATIEEANKYYFGRIKVEASQEKLIKTVADQTFTDLGENCKTYNDGTDTFLTGQCANNYVWYSGKLWRVVLKNNQTGAVKMVTDNAITTITYNAGGNPAFENSYMDQWLNQEFLPTLHDTSEYLVENSVWDATLNSSSTPARPTGTTIVQRTVGLLNSYEYYTTYNNSGGIATSSTGYLNNKASGSYDIYWWLLTPYSSSSVRIVNINGRLNRSNPANGNGARPSVNLKSSIQIESGTGTQSNPYILKGDTQETINGTTLISTRYSGEYITFNNELYRIVGVETVNGEQLTKIIAVDKPSALASNKFHSASGVTDFASAAIKTDLETYYQGLATSNINAYNMIQPSTMWYLGTVGGGVNYKASICATVDTIKSMQECTEKAKSTTANIGLPRVGEMFTSQITRGSRTSFWTLTPYSSSSVRGVDYSGYLNVYDPTSGYGARPSMYLKSTIKIASNNTGNGTYEKPYTIE